MKETKKFIIRKFVMATSAQEALKKEQKAAVVDVRVDEEWLFESERSQMGFKVRKAKHG